MATKSFNAISQSIINNILTVNPNVDIKIGEAVRDLFIDVQAAQLQSLYSIVDFASRGQSVLTAQGQQLDRLGYNQGIARLAATRSTGAITLVIQGGITAPTLINVGDQFYTAADQTGTSYTFIAAQTLLLTPGLTQITIPIVALTPGSASNVPANAIKQSNYDFVDSVYNAEPTSGGADQETDAAFALRIPTFLTGAYINVSNGINRIMLSVENTSSVVNIVAPGQALSRGQYKVDVYIQRAPGYFGTPVLETIPANTTVCVLSQQPLYELNPVNQVTVYNPTTNTTQVIPPKVGGVTQYQIVDNPADPDYLTHGSVKAEQQLQWLVAPPIYPYVVDYNVDQTVIDAQNAYNKYNEVVADVLFRQSIAIPVWVSASVQAASGANSQQIVNRAQTNLLSLFGNFGSMPTLGPNNVVYSLLSDKNLTNVNLANLDTSYEVVLTATGTDGNYSFGVNLPNSNYLAKHTFTPLGLYFDNSVGNDIFTPFQSRLFVTNPNRVPPIAPSLDMVSIVPGTGVVNRDLVQGITTNWGANVDTYYDTRTQTLVVNFDVAPTAALVAAKNPGVHNPVPTIKFNLVQPSLIPSGTLSYLVLAPSLVSPLVPFAGQQATSSLVYATVCPDGLDSTRAKVYKNGVALALSLDGVTGDYTSNGPDANGVYTITLLATPLATDILQFGLLNPDLALS